MTELPTKYDPAAIEKAVYQTWLDEKCFAADAAAPGEPYSIVIPPPNVTGALHLGHAINNTLQDILTRKARMEGKNAVWIPGLDHAGIATQAVVEKQLKEKENKTRHDVGREGLVERIWQWKQQFGDRILSQLQRLGCSCDWDRTRFTLDEQCARAVRETFFKLFKDGLVYRGKRLVNWDTHLQTSISDDEIYHEAVKTSLWHIRYEIVDNASATGQAFLLPSGEGEDEGDLAGNVSPDQKAPGSNHPHPNLLPKGEGTRPAGRSSFMVVATTRPETLLGDTAVAVNSADDRWNWAIGLQVKLPLTGRLIPIIADDILVDPKFGTGVVKVTPAHDPNDYAVWQRHQTQPDAIDLINLMNPDGTLNAAAGERYAGLTMGKARDKVVADLESAGLLEKVEPYETQVGHSDRSKTPIQPYLSDQWFVKMAPLAEPALEVVKNGTIQFFPERHKQQYLSWLGEKRDWPISRQLWWGHRIPVWSKGVDDKDQSNSNDVEHWRKWLEGNCSLEWKRAGNDFPELAWTFTKDATGPRAFACLSQENAAAEHKLKEWGFVQDPDVLDTWFSSALWPFSTLGWPEKTADLAKWYPTSVLMTGRDIITLWVARMVMMGMYNLGNAEHRMQNAELNAPPSDPDSALCTLNSALSSGIPFAHVAINPTILDGKGERMSKSKGNGVDPVDVIDTHGADALRFTLATMATETQDVRMPVKKDAEGRNTSDKFDAGRNFCNKLWNAARFVMSQTNTGMNTETQRRREEADAPDSSLRLCVSAFNSLPDRWIMSRFNRAISEANAAIAIYRFDVYAKVCYDFFWRDFCDWYVETIKPVLKTDAGSGSAAVLMQMLDGVLRLMHPMIPFITEAIWWNLNDARPVRDGVGAIKSRLMLSAWPAGGAIDEAAESQFANLQTLIVAIRNARSENNVEIKRTVPVTIVAPAGEAGVIEANRAMIETLATCTIAAILPAAPADTQASRVAAGPFELLIEGLVDPNAEKDRVAKRIVELTKQESQLAGRLTNEGYLAKAPPKLVQETQDQLAAVRAELAKLRGG